MTIHIRKVSAFMLILLHIFLTGCNSWQTPQSSSDLLPPIYPDYIDATVPSNIAPLNFMVEEADRIQAVFSVSGEQTLQLTGKESVITIPEKKWHGLIANAKGGSIDVEVYVWNEEHPEGIAYSPFKINVAEEAIDGWIAYRLIEPGYRSWRQLGLYQRDLTSFDESAIVTNATTNETCLNCHHFPSYSSQSMMFHARGANGGTILYHNGELTKIKFNEIGPKKNTTYPAWHPDGRYIAFSSNTTRQTFYVHGRKPIEVYDYASDLVLYDTKSGDVLTDPRFMTEEILETFPAWAPDGKSLYFASAMAKDVPKEVEEVHYHLLRVPFDPSTGRFGEQTDTLYNAHVLNGSASYPRISADGRYLLYTWSEYGTFPIWHEEADLRMMDLQTLQPVDVSIWNDDASADSYHSWSSDSRWVIYGSRRHDGRYTQLYIAYFDEDGNPHKPFLLPQEDPRYNMWRLKSYNVPEFIDGEVQLPKSVTKLFEPEK
jgi:hypothetical protein